MAQDQAADPVTPGTLPTVVEPAKETVLTGTKTPEGTAPLATGAAPELPRPWMTGLTTEQKANADLVKTLSRYEKGIPDLAKAVVDLEQKVGNAVVVPGEKATLEERAAYRKAMGVPDKPEDYKLEDLKLPIPKEILAKIDKSLKETAHGLNLTPTQVNGLRSWHLLQEYETMKERLDALPTAKQCQDVLARQYGTQVNVALEQANRAYTRYVSPSLQAKISATGLANDPEAVTMFVEIGKMISEAPFVDGKSAGRPVTATGERSNAELAEIMFGNAGSKG
jgi:hypothetical protein